MGGGGSRAPRNVNPALASVSCVCPGNEVGICLHLRACAGRNTCGACAGKKHAWNVSSACAWPVPNICSKIQLISNFEHSVSFKF